ncbi:MAG: hypothetical protein JWO62_1657 [Acidimicrobiaceae bacterium]|nr:hypothetical protein [Acidimicrobiaceae bacterium]
MEVTPYPKPPPRKTRRPRPIRAYSAKRAAQREPRAKAVAIAMERDGRRCQWADRVAAAAPIAMRTNLLRCFGELTPHEPGGMRYVDRTDPNEIVILCVRHNELVESEPNIARALGLRPENRQAVRKSYPLSHVAGAFSQAESDRDEAS